MDLINNAELIHYPQQGNMGLNFQGPKGEKVSYSYFLFSFKDALCPPSLIMNYFPMFMSKSG